MGRWRYTLTGVVAACLFTTGGGIAADSPFDALASKLPADANVVMAADIQSLFRSQLSDIEPGAKTKANSTEKRTFYYKQYADKIDSLPILNVDPKMVQFGQAVSVTLRNLAQLSTMTASAYNNALAQYRTGFGMNTVGGSYGGYGGYGGGGWSYSSYAPSAVNVDNFMDVRNMMASTAQNSQALRAQTWANIKKSMQTVRGQLVETYKTEV